MLWKDRLSIKFIFIVTTTMAVIFLSYALFLGWKETRVMQDEYVAQGQKTTEFLAYMAVEPIQTYDFSALEEYASQLSGDGETIRYVVFTDNEDDQLFSTGILNDDANIKLLTAPILLGNDRIGSVRVGLDIGQVNFMVRHMQTIHLAGTGIVITFLAVVIFLLFRVYVLRPVENLNKTVLDSVDSIICVADKGSQDIIYANKYMMGIYGDVQGRSLRDVTGDEGLIRHNAVMTEGSYPEGKFHKWEFKEKKESKWYEASAKDIEWIDGRNARLYMAVDISDRKAIEHERRRYQEDLENMVSERTEELNETISLLKNEISERRKYEQALLESELQFSQIFSQEDDALLVISSESYEVLDVNPSAVDLFGFSKHELFNRGISAFFSDGNFDRFIRSLNHAYGDRGSKIDKLECKKRDGTKIMVSVRSKSIMMIERDVIYCSFRDITEKIRMMHESQMLQSKLIHANKMSSLGVLVSGVAHEINNPNNFIMFNSQLMLDAWRDISGLLDKHKKEEGDTQIGGLPLDEMTEAMPKLLGGIKEGSKRIKKIVENLRQFAKQDSSSLDDMVMLDRVVSEAVSLIHYSVSKYTDNFIVDVQDTPPVKGSAQQLEQVLINLVINALQSLRDKGEKVVVSLSFDTDRHEIVIKVIDEGRGMSPEILEFVKDPFFTTKMDMGGTGLGLSISHSIVNDHNGTLEFESETDRGTTAIVRLPVAEKEGAGR